LQQVQLAYTEQDEFQERLQRTLDAANAEAQNKARELEARAAREAQAHAEQARAAAQLEEARRRLLNQEKLASIGTLAAGIAHEINTPTQYVSDNLAFLGESFGELLDVLDRFLAQNGGRVPDGCDADLDFLREEIPAALRQSVEGIERVAKIVLSVKEFSHPGGNGRVAVDLNRAIQSTLTVCRNEWKYVAEVETDLDPHLPLVPCFPGEINQVFLNLVVNAAQAIEDARRADASPRSGLIRVRTRVEDRVVHISIEDNGCGIPEAVANRIFDPFFTTKEVGRGTGQGLAIARSVVVQKHGGELSFESRPGCGTTFHVFLPLEGSPT
jgi:signal transduction histidine kinase